MHTTLDDALFIRELARRCGTLALAAAGSLEREFKGDQSLVTNVDRAVEQMLRQEVAARFPGDAFYGEEFGGDPLEAERLWIADPIDGTINYAFGLPVWGVSIGLAVAGVPELGAFHLPITGETYWFQRGQGAWCNERPLRISEGGPLHPEDPIGIGSEAILVVDMQGFPWRQRNFGSLAAHWCYTAAGALRANVSVMDKLHDLGAAFGLAAEAGCAIEYLDGGAVEFATFLSQPTNLRPIVVGAAGAVGHLRKVVRERPSGIDDLGE